MNKNFTSAIEEAENIVNEYILKIEKQDIPPKKRSRIFFNLGHIYERIRRRHGKSI